MMELILFNKVDSKYEEMYSLFLSEKGQNFPEDLISQLNYRWLWKQKLTDYFYVRITYEVEIIQLQEKYVSTVFDHLKLTGRELCKWSLWLAKILWLHCNALL